MIDMVDIMNRKDYKVIGIRGEKVKTEINN